MSVTPATAKRAVDAVSPHSRLMVLLFTDIVGSTELKNRLGTVEYAEHLSRHDGLFRAIVESIEGARILKDTGDGFFVSFATASDAVRAALMFQFDLSQSASPLRTRVGVHVGEVTEIEREQNGLPKIVGLAADFAARLMDLAAGGQVLLTRFAFDEARQFVRSHPPLDGVADLPLLRWVAHGEYLFKGGSEPIDVFEVGAVGIAPLAPPADNENARRNVRPGDELTLGWRPAGGLEMRNRPNWIIKEKLGEGGFGEVWLAEHNKTGIRRVMKFCFEPERLRGLKREVVLFRLLKEVLGERRDIARIVDFQFDESPYFIETEYFAAGTLHDWAASHGGLDKIAIAQRVRVVADIAQALAAAHSVGVLHKDLKPSNILMSDDGDGQMHPVLTDFGIGILTDRSALAKHDITVVGFTEDAAITNDSSRTGTRIYAPPESLLNKPFTVQGDIYALGVLLYQMVVGDLNRPLAEGWERHVDDGLLRADIAACVDGDPQRRLASAKELSDRVRRLAERREANERAASSALASRRRQRALKVMATLLAIVGAIAAALALALFERNRRVVAERERGATEQRLRADAEAARDRSKQEADKAEAVTAFLRDMLTMADPARGHRPNMTVREMLDVASQRVEASKPADPDVEAAIRGAIGRTYLTLGLYPAAETQLGKTIEIVNGSNVAKDSRWGLKYASDFSVVQMYTAKYPASEPLMLDLLARREKTLGPDDPDTADSLYNLAILYVKMNRFDDAESYAKRALAARQRAGAETAPVAAAYQILATIYEAQKKLDLAEDFQRKAIALREKVLGPDHFEVANSYNNLGLILMNTDRVDEAEKSYTKALSIFEKSVDPEHPFAAMTLSNLAAINLRRGEYDKAQPFAARALQIQEKLLGPDHPDSVQSILAVATVHYAHQDLPKARAMFERALALAEKSFGPMHPSTVHAEVSLGFVCRDAHDFPAARKYLASSREKFRKMGDISRAYQTQIGLIEAIVWEGNDAEAEPMADALMNDAKGIADQTLRDRYTADAMRILITIYDKTGRKPLADKYRQQLGISEPATAPTTQAS